MTTNTKTFKRGDSIIYITSFLLRPHDDIEELSEIEMTASRLVAAQNGQGVELGFIERDGNGGAWCRFFRLHNGQWILRNTANGEFAVNANIRRFDHAATHLIPDGLVKVEEWNRRMAALDTPNTGNTP